LKAAYEERRIEVIDTVFMLFDEKRIITMEVL